MGYNFLPYDQNQLYLLPPSINEWVPEESLPRFIDEVVETLDMKGRLQSFYERYRADGWGRAAYHPKMMVKVLLYAYCHGVTSSRRIARGLENDVGLRYLSANQQPDFRTIADFRKDNLDAIRGLHIEVLELCREAGLMKMGRVALDGRKDRWSPKFGQYAKVAPALVIEGQEQWQNDAVSLHNSRHESLWKLFLVPTRWPNWPRSTAYTPT